MSCSLLCLIHGNVSSPISGCYLWHPFSGKDYCENSLITQHFSVPNRVTVVSNFPNKSISTRILHTQAFPGKLSESSLSKHLTCVSRTYSQPHPVNQINLHTSLCYLQTSCRSLHCPAPHLCLQGPTPNLSLSRHSQASKKTCCSRQSIDKSLSSNDLTANMPKKWKQNTSPESRILKLFDALDSTSANVPLQTLSTSSTQT